MNLLNQKGFTMIAFIVLIIVLATSIAGGSFVVTKNSTVRRLLNLSPYNPKNLPTELSKNELNNINSRTIPFDGNQLELTSITESPITIEEKILSGANTPIKVSSFYIDAKINIPFSGKYGVTSPSLDTMNGGIALDGKEVVIFDFVPKEYSARFTFSDNSCPGAGFEERFYGDQTRKPMRLKLEIAEMITSIEVPPDTLKKYVAEYVTTNSYRKSDFYQHCKESNKVYFDSISN